MQVGGSNKDAYELLQALQKNNCKPPVEEEKKEEGKDGQGKCDVSKAGCENSMWKDAIKPDCWAAEAYQRCPNARQQAYDAINRVGGNTPVAYCALLALIISDCAMESK